MKREEYEERMKNERYRDLVVTKHDDEEGRDYVFISYRGNNWRKVLTEIVYKLQKEYGLRIYFDKEFASETNIWIKQFRRNMDSRHCKAFLCFFDEGYVTSYATLLELMHAMNPRSKLSDAIYPISFPIDWRKLDDCEWDTGLGKEDQDNPGWEEELKAFKQEFELIEEKYPKVKAYYYEGEPLRAVDCKDIMAILQPRNKRDFVDEEAYYRQFIVNPLKEKYPSVFAKVTEPSAIKPSGASDVKPSEAPAAKLPETSDVKPSEAPAIKPSEPQPGSASPKESAAGEGGGKGQDPEPVKADGYRYTIFGKEYEAGNREQGKLMFDAFEALASRYPDCPEKLIQRLSVARAEDVTDAGTQDADPVYFRGCKEFEIGERKYLVGTSFSFNAKLTEIKGMFKLCGADPGEFVLNGEPLVSGKGAGKKREGEKEDDGGPEDGFRYELWNIPYTAGSMADLMHDVFDRIAEKYPQRIPDIAESEKISAVAKKEDVDGERLAPGKLNYFRARKEHALDGAVYYVGTSYNREQGIGQLKRMLKLCEGNTDALVISSEPEKTKRHKSGKMGLNVDAMDV